MKKDRVTTFVPGLLCCWFPYVKILWFKFGLSPVFRVGYDAQMPDLIGFTDFAKLAEIEPPLPTIEELPVSVTPLFF